MRREKATEERDLPHQYVDGRGERCRLCQATALDARHLSWEKAQETPASWAGVQRELGT